MDRRNRHSVVLIRFETVVRRSDGKRMLKITSHESAQARVTMTLEGRVVAEWVMLLEQECTRHQQHERRIVLQCDGVTYVDASGSAMLQRLQSQGVEIRGCSALIDSLIKRM